MKVAVPERVVTRILSRIVKSADGCWNWPGATQAGGYGHIAWQDANVQHHRSTHRALYEGTVGPVAKGLDLDHLCRNRLCCNPDHLEPVTRRENLLRGQTVTADRAARTHCPANHKYTPENTRVDAKNRRICKECCRIRNRAISPEKKREYNARAYAKAHQKP